MISPSRAVAAVCLLAAVGQPVQAQDIVSSATVPMAPEPRRIVLPDHLPAACFMQTAQDYQVPPEILVAIAQVESRGRAVVGRNRNGTLDLGVMQHNTASWAPYFERRYGIRRDALLANPCQSIRAAGYVLRTELNTRACAGQDVWCGVGRYHAPNDAQASAAYVARVQSALREMLQTGRMQRAGDAAARAAEER